MASRYQYEVYRDQSSLVISSRLHLRHCRAYMLPDCLTPGVNCWCTHVVLQIQDGLPFYIVLGVAGYLKTESLGL